MLFTPLGFAVMLIKHQQVRRTARLFTLSSVQVPILLPDGLEFNTLISAFCSGNHMFTLAQFLHLGSLCFRSINYGFHMCVKDGVTTRLSPPERTSGNRETQHWAN